MAVPLGPVASAVQARRQAGSAFKTFVYAAALERGYTPASLITPMQEPIVTYEGAWVPDDHTGGGLMTMRSALRLSSNRAAVRLMETVGVRKAVRAASAFGFGDLPVVLVTALGSQKDREYGIEVGANAYIAKSDFDQSNLLEIIRRLL